MKTDIVRQPFLFASASSLVLAGLGAAFNLPSDAVSGGAAAPLGGLISAFQHSCPVWSAVAVFVAAMYCGYLLMRSSVRYDLYGSRTYVVIVLFPLVACCISDGGEWLRNWCAMVALVLAGCNYEAGFKRSYRFGEIFRGSFFLGTVPLIYAPAIPLLLLLPLLLFVFRRPAREVPVALVGLFLPAAMASYVWWACGYDFTYVANCILDAAAEPSGYSVFAGMSLPELAVTGVVLFIVLASAGVYLFEFRSLKFKARCIHIYYMSQALLCLSTFALSGADGGSLVLLSIFCAIVMPLLFVRAPARFSLVLYVLLLVTAVVSMLV